MRESILKNKSYGFALEIVELSKSLTSEKREFILSKQLMRSGTSVGAKKLNLHNRQKILFIK